MERSKNAQMSEPYARAWIPTRMLGAPLTASEKVRGLHYQRKARLSVSPAYTVLRVPSDLGDRKFCGIEIFSSGIH